jgi:large subunit ribosomal protein L22
MKVEASLKYTQISARKFINFARNLKNKPVEEAITIAHFSNLKGARLIEKTLKSALANAEHNADGNPEDFKVEKVLIERGPSMKRYRPGARGMVKPYEKRTSHIRVSLVNE